MTRTPAAPPSVWRLRWDLLWGRLLLGLTRAEQRGELRPEVHRFLSESYTWLARHQRDHGRRVQAARLAAKAQAHATLAGGDDLPPACAMGLPRQRMRIAIEARGRVVPGPWPRSRPRSSGPAR